MSHSGTFFIRNLLSAAAGTPLYGPEHPHVHHLLQETALSLEHALNAKPELTVDVIGSELVIDNRPQPFNIYLSRCAALLSSRGVARLRFTKGVSLRELSSLVTGLALPGENGGRLASSQNIKLGRLDAERSGEKAGETASDDSAPGRKLLQGLAQQERAAWTELREAVRKGRKGNLAGMSAIVSGLVDAIKEEANAPILAALGKMDEIALSHATNVAALTLALAISAGVEGPLLHDIGIAAMLHDIGKLFSPPELLSKKGNLTEEERKIMREHPVKGATYLLDLPGVPRLAVLAALEHHMKYDRSGYPRVRSGWNINSCSHMVMVADLFDTVRRQQQCSADLAGESIGKMMARLSGVDLHPFWTQRFLAIIGDQGMCQLFRQ